MARSGGFLHDRFVGARRCLRTLLAICRPSGAIDRQGRPTTTPIVCGLALQCGGFIATWTPRGVGATEMLLMCMLCLAAGSAIWTLVWPKRTSIIPQAEAGGHVVAVHVMVQCAVAIFALVVAIHVARDILDVPHRRLQTLDWLTLAAIVAAIAVYLWSTTARFPTSALYITGLALVGMLLILRDLSPGRFVIWTGICELTGFVLIAALLGWVVQLFPIVVTKLRIPGGSARFSGKWFCASQAVLTAAAAALIVWILLDFSFDSLGRNTAVLGLSGRLTSCPAALMLVGTTILMAWQTRGRWRSGWQYATMAAGVLFTTSIGWARIDVTAGSPFTRRSTYLMISAAMMTLLTGFGLPRVLPGSGDWIPRARRAAYVFGGLASLLAVMALIQLATR